MGRIVVVLLFILASSNVSSQDKKKDEIYFLQEFEVVNSNMFPVLDTIIKLKENIQYYKGTKLFTIEFNEDSIRTDLIFVRAQENQIYYYYPDILGYFDYKEHTFVIRGDFINTTIFQELNSCRDFNFSIPPIEFTTKGEPIIRSFDNFAVWSMRYKDGDFKILSFLTNNKADSWFDYIEEEYNE